VWDLLGVMKRLTRLVGHAFMVLGLIAVGLVSLALFAIVAVYLLTGIMNFVMR
jgi:hypothetical protein